MSVVSLVSSGPLLLAIPVAVAAGAVTFLSPCCLPLVPGYLAYITGMSRADGAGDRGRAAGTGGGGGEAGGAGGPPPRPRPAPAAPADAPRGRAVAGALLFVLGFS